MCRILWATSASNPCIQWAGLSSLHGQLLCAFADSQQHLTHTALTSVHMQQDQLLSQQASRRKWPYADYQPFLRRNWPMHILPALPPSRELQIESWLSYIIIHILATLISVHRSFMLTVIFKLVVQGFWKWVVSLVSTTLQPKVLGFVWCTLSHCLFPKAMDNQPEKYSSPKNLGYRLKRKVSKRPGHHQV